VKGWTQKIVCVILVAAMCAGCATTGAGRGPTFAPTAEPAQGSTAQPVNGWQVLGAIVLLPVYVLALGIVILAMVETGPYGGYGYGGVSTCRTYTYKDELWTKCY
jgi:hypothetical protein